MERRAWISALQETKAAAVPRNATEMLNDRGQCSMEFCVFLCLLVLFPLGSGVPGVGSSHCDPDQDKAATGDE